MTVVYNSEGNTIGAYDGDIDSGKFYDKDGKEIPQEKIESFVPFVINSDFIKSVKIV